MRTIKEQNITTEQAQEFIEEVARRTLPNKRDTCYVLEEMYAAAQAAHSQPESAKKTVPSIPESQSIVKLIQPQPLPEVSPKPDDTPEPPTTSKRISSKQRKLSLEEYRATYLQVPKIEDRKPVFVSREVRDRLDEIVRRLGGRRMSVSGLLENLAQLHIATYQDDIEQWRKL